MRAKPDRVSSIMQKLFGRFFKRFNSGFDKASNAYQRTLTLTLRRTGIAMVLYVGLLGFTALA